MITGMEVDGLRYTIEYPDEPGERDRRPWCVFLHGFLGTSADFYRISAPLADKIAPIFIDLPGHGETETPKHSERCTTGKLVRDVEAIIRAVTNETVFLMGYSMGGRLALHTAVTHPELFRGLILESTSTGITDAESREERRRVDESRAAELKKDFSGFVDEWNHLPLFNRGKGSHETGKQDITLQILQKLHDPEGPAAMLQGFGAGVMPAITDRELRQLTMPVLLIAGAKDTKYVDIQHRLKQKLDNAEVHIIPDAAHRVHMDAPEAFTNTLRTFLNQNEGNYELDNC